MADELTTPPAGRIAGSGLTYRTFTLRAVRAEAETPGEDAAESGEEGVEVDAQGRIRVALSSEAPVMRWDWRTGEEFNEVLDHGAIDLSRCTAQGGLPLITDHDRWNSDAQVGLLEDHEVGADRMLRFWARFSRGERAQEYRQDVLDGIRRTVSVGYAPGDDYTQTKAAGASIPTRTYRNWQPHEGSFTPVPADVAVGFGRAVNAAPAGAGRAATNARSGQELRMSDVTTTPAASAPTVVVGDGGERTATVRELAALAKEHQMEQHLPRWIENNVSIANAARECATEASKRAAMVRTDVPLVDLNEKEQKQFSFARAILANDPEWGRKFDAGFEREVSDQMRREAQTRGVPVVGKGQIMLPSRLSRNPIGQRATLTSSTASAGGVLKFNQPGDFIEYLYARIKTLGLGAQFLSGLTGPVVFPRGVASTTAVWSNEAPGSDATQSAATFDSVTLAFNTLIVNQPISRQLLFSAASGGYDAEMMIRKDMASVHAVAIETAGIAGTGSGQATGIISTSGVNLVTLGANGGTMTWAKTLEMEQAVADQNADVDSMGFLTNSKQRAVLRNVAVLGNTASGQPVWTFGNGPGDNRVMGYQAAATNAVPRTLTKGTATTVCSAIIFGDFSQLIYGEWGGFEVLADPYTLAAQGAVRLVSFQAVSSVVKQPKAFAQIVDAL